MGITLGDVLTVLSLMVAVMLSGWAMITISGLVFKRSAALSKESIVKKPVQCGLLGLVVSFFAILIPLVMVQVPMPLIKILGVSLWGVYLVFVSVGAAGIATLLTERIGALDANHSPFVALTRSSTLIVLASSLPIIGWFLVGPLVLLVSSGAAAKNVFARRTEPVEAPPVQA